MEKFAYEIEDLFKEKLEIYKELKEIFKEEKIAIVDMDVDSLWKITDRKNKLAEDIQTVKYNVLSLVHSKKLNLDMEIKTFSLDRVIQCLPAPLKIKSNLKKINITLGTLKEEVIRLALLNKKFVNEHLSVIDGIFSTVMGSENREQYTPGGILSEDKAPNSLIRAEV